MYKCKLQVLVQRRGWELPEYTTKKSGPDHEPTFTCSVRVRDDVFQTPEPCKATKVAQDTAAKLAFDHYYVPPPPPRVIRRPLPPVDAAAAPTSPPVPTSPPPQDTPAAAPPPPSPPLPVSPHPSSLPIPAGILSRKTDANQEELHQKHEDTMVYTTPIGLQDNSFKEPLNMYKNRLQQYAQKQNLGFPVYTCEAEGPPHARRFKARISLDGKLYEAPEHFTTVKEAEQAVAKVACQVLSVDAFQEGGGLYKNLLQEFSQKNGFLCPTYETTVFGLSHRPLFVSTVVIGSNTFRGAEAKTKKQAEMNAAKVAYCALMGITDKLADAESSRVSSVNANAVSDNLTQIIQATSEIKQPLGATNEADSSKGYEGKSDKSPEDQIKSFPGNMTMDASPPAPLDRKSSAANISPVSFKMTHANAAVTKQPAENLASSDRPCKIMVFPRNSPLPVPQGATVLPYSDEKWVAYRVEINKEPTA